MKLEKTFTDNNINSYKSIEINDLSMEELEKVLIFKNLNPEIMVSDILCQVHNIIK